MKKAQIMGQPFVYIFALVVGALILFWGARTVIKLVERSEMVEVVDFIKTLESTVNEYYMLDEGSEKTIKLRLPKKISYFCVADENAQSCKTSSGSGCGGIKELEQISRVCKGYNICLAPVNALKTTRFKISKSGRMRASESQDLIVCFKNGESIKIVSKGDYVLIRKA